MALPQPELPDYLEHTRRLGPDDTFAFTCHAGVPCFNQCCHDVNIILTPLDVLRLARHLGMHTRLFLETHTSNPITKDLHLPVVMLRMRDDDGSKPCPFLTTDGCGVYDERPWACRMYPLGEALPPARAGEQPRPVWFVFEHDHCQGRHQPDCSTWTVETWRRDQGIEGRDELDAGFRELVSHPWFIGGRRLDPKRMHMFYTACYDLDGFRSFVFESSFLDRFELEPELVRTLATDDDALLTFAFTWLRFALFGEPTLKVREGWASQRSQDA